MCRAARVPHRMSRWVCPTVRDTSTATYKRGGDQRPGSCCLSGTAVRSTQEGGPSSDSQWNTAQSLFRSLHQQIQSNLILFCAGEPCLVSPGVQDVQTGLPKAVRE